MNSTDVISLATHIANELNDDATDNDIHDLQKIINKWQKEKERVKKTTKRQKTVKAKAATKNTKMTEFETRKSQWPPEDWQYDDVIKKAEYNALLAKLQKKGDKYVYDVGKSTYIYNPDSGIWVSRTGAVAKRIAAKYGYANILRWSFEFLELYGREAINARV